MPNGRSEAEKRVDLDLITGISFSSFEFVREEGSDGGRVVEMREEVINMLLADSEFCQFLHLHEGMPQMMRRLQPIIEHLQEALDHEAIFSEIGMLPCI